MTYVIVACNRKLLQKEQRKGIRLSRTHVINKTSKHTIMCPNNKAE
jgi:hypothetical protein